MSGVWMRHFVGSKGDRGRGGAVVPYGVADGWCAAQAVVISISGAG